MMVKTHLTALIDTCFWYAICDSKDSYHEEAVAKNFDFDNCHILLPWPCLYETINTKFVKTPSVIETFERIAKKQNLEFVDDSNYRNTAYEQIIQSAIRNKRPISLVDLVVRLMLDDVNLQVNYLVTFDIKDFVDICQKRRIEIL